MGSKLRNGDMRVILGSKDGQSDCVVIEMVASYGLPVGAEIFETCVEIGRFMENARSAFVHRMYRKAVVTHLCNSPRGNDASVRQAIIDRYGGKDKAIGKKASKGPLYGITGDVWQALGLAIAWREKHLSTCKPPASRSCSEAARCTPCCPRTAARDAKALIR